MCNATRLADIALKPACSHGRTDSVHVQTLGSILPKIKASAICLHSSRTEVQGSNTSTAEDTQLPISPSEYGFSREAKEAPQIPEAPIRSVFQPKQ